MKKILLSSSLLILTALMSSSIAQAAVTEAEAAKLGNELTPLGGERAANADGSIPEWTGGIAQKPREGGPLPPDPFADDKVQFKINSANMDQYADLLSEGTKEVLRKYPDFSVNVYETRRTAAAPQYVYENTKKNALNTRLSADGLTLDGNYGGIPFPLAKTGIEMYWNHTMRVSAHAYEFSVTNIVGSADGRTTLASRADDVNQTPYYDPNGNIEDWNGDYVLARLTNTAPVFKAGESLVIRDSIRQPRAAWQYLVGQRRVRRAPNIGYDTPDFVASGANYFDEVSGFFGEPDRYNWNLVGKKEMFIPYNNNRFINTPVDEAFIAHYPNPDKMRWERHRVWVVEATLADGKRHAVPKRTFYFDEDTWIISMIDGYDAKDQLWRANWTFSFVAPEVPVIVALSSCIFDFQASTYSCPSFVNGGYWRTIEPKRDSYFTGDALASEGIR